MTEIFTNMTLADSREIKYLNYLSVNLLRKTFEKFANCSKVDFLQKDYQEKLFNANLVLIPKKDFLIKEDFTFSEKLYLKNVNKIIKDLRTAESYFYIYRVNDLDLVVLDERLSNVFRSNVKLQKDRIIILNKSSRFLQYKDIVYGINSINCKYNSQLNLQQFMNLDLKKIYEKEKYLKNYCVYYSLGTTAVSAKNLTF